MPVVSVQIILPFESPTCTNNYATVHLVIFAICEHVGAQEAGGIRGGVAAGVYEAANFGVVVARLEIVEACLGIVGIFIRDIIILFFCRPVKFIIRILYCLPVCCEWTWIDIRRLYGGEDI